MLRERADAIANKLIGSSLVGLSTLFFIAASTGAGRTPELALMPALGFGITGLWMLLRRHRAMPAATPELALEVQKLRETLTHVQIELDGTQTQVERLIEERVFLERLLKERVEAKQLP
jgi:hypothetical protein